MTVVAGADCRACGRQPADFWLGGGGPFCDGCFDERISAATGWPRLPEPPTPLEITGPGGRHHMLRYRISRAPTGVTVELREMLAPNDVGFEFAVLGDHDANVGRLLEGVTSIRSTHRHGSRFAGVPTRSWNPATSSATVKAGHARMAADDPPACPGDS